MNQVGLCDFSTFLTLGGLARENQTVIETSVSRSLRVHFLRIPALNGAEKSV